MTPQPNPNDTAWKRETLDASYRAHDKFLGSPQVEPHRPAQKVSGKLVLGRVEGADYFYKWVEGEA